MSREQRDIFVKQRLDNIADIYEQIESYLTQYKKNDDLGYVGYNYPVGVSQKSLMTPEDAQHYHDTLEQIGLMKKETVAIARIGPAALKGSRRQRYMLRGLIAFTGIAIVIFIAVILHELRRLAH